VTPRGGVETSGGVVDCIIMAVGGADMPLNELPDEWSAIRGDSWLTDEETDPGRRSSVMA
jgi:hypothetical protein